jgi:hypothetical protein
MVGVAVGWQLYSLTGSESGLAAAVLGTVPAVLLGGVGTIAVASLWLVFFPELRRLGRFEE